MPRLLKKTLFKNLEKEKTIQEQKVVFSFWAPAAQ
jgi:hypothetical protein